MDERTLIFQKVQKGEMIFTLEKDRRSGYPIFFYSKNRKGRRK